LCVLTISGAIGCIGGLDVRTIVLSTIEAIIVFTAMLLIGAAAVFAGAARFADARAGFALRRLALAPGFFTDLRADLADFDAFFLVPAAALEVRPADFTDALLILVIIAANFI
jgi:hypothetical protein